MAIKQLRLGSFGPFNFNDGYAFRDGLSAIGLRTDAVINSTATPTDANDLVRVTDISAIADAVKFEARRYALLTRGGS